MIKATSSKIIRYLQPQSSPLYNSYYIPLVSTTCTVNMVNLSKLLLIAVCAAIASAVSFSCQLPIPKANPSESKECS